MLAVAYLGGCINCGIVLDAGQTIQHASGVVIRLGQDRNEK